MLNQLETSDTWADVIGVVTEHQPMGCRYRDPSIHPSIHPFHIYFNIVMT